MGTWGGDTARLILGEHQLLDGRATVRRTTRSPKESDRGHDGPLAPEERAVMRTSTPAWTPCPR
jgi:hypothetical protein